MKLVVNVGVPQLSVAVGAVQVAVAVFGVGAMLKLKSPSVTAGVPVLVPVRVNVYQHDAPRPLVRRFAPLPTWNDGPRRETVKVTPFDALPEPVKVPLMPV